MIDDNNFKHIIKLIDPHVNWSNVAKSLGISLRTVYSYKTGQIKSTLTAMAIIDNALAQMKNTADNNTSVLSAIKKHPKLSAVYKKTIIGAATP